ncbi:MAG: FecR domain-containing protein [Terrimicrobiaceae bacterium]
MLQAAAQAEPFKQAEVTKTVNIVSLLPEMQSPRAATIGDIISGRTALTTADASRAELQFPDLTLTRVGANALFRFYAGGRDMVLDGGTMLFYSPRGAGGGKVQAGAITAAVTGTDFLVSYVKGPASKGGRVKVICLSHTVLVFFTANPRERRLLRPGDMVDVPNGATKLPPVATVSLSLVMSSGELFVSSGFGPLPSQPLLKQLAETQQKKIVSIPGATPQDEEALSSALANLESRGLDAAVVVGAVGQVAESPAAVEALVGQVARATSSDEALMTTVEAVARKYPSLAISIARGAAEGTPRLAPTIAAAVAATFPQRAVAITYAVASVAPSGARAIGQAVAAVVPDQQKQILSVAGATAQDIEALSSALAILESRGFDADAVIEAVGQVARNPVLAEIVMAQVARATSSDEALMTTVEAVARKYPSLAISIARGAVEGAPRLAPAIAATVAAIFPKQAVAITYAVAEVAPSAARAIAQEVVAVVPDQQKQILSIPDAIAQDMEALRSALALLESRGLDSAAVIEAVGQVADKPALVEVLMGKVAGSSSSDEAFVIIVEGVARTYPSLAISIARGATEGAPRLAPAIAATVAAIFPQQAMAISYAVAGVAPADARAIVQAVVAVVPDQRDLIFASVRSIPGLRWDLAELGFSFGQGMNPANLVGGTTQSNEVTGPSSGQQGGANSTPSGPPQIAVISPEN